MAIRPLTCASLAVLLLGAQASAQGVEAPSWLSESIVAPHANIATSAIPAPITAMPLGVARIDGVGLLPPSVTGLPSNLWGPSETADLAAMFRGLPREGLPAILSLTQTLALAELDAPADAGPDPVLLLARIDMLMDRGALEPARALAERAGPTDPQLFRRFFDLSLMTGQAERACAAMRANPDIAPAFPARIFCLARSGDWSAAALSLGTGAALGQIPEDQADLIARFLDPELFEGAPSLPPDRAITPLFYEMRAAIGERPSSTDLPPAFAHSDLSDVAGWRAQLAAAERLIRTGAIEPQQWLAIATGNSSSISGAIWERARLLRELDAAVLANDARSVARVLPDAVTAMDEANLTVAFAALFGEALLRLPLTGEPAIIAHRVALLSPGYELAAMRTTPQNRLERFVFSIARGEAADAPTNDAVALGVAQAFRSTEMPARYRTLTSEGRLGEALLAASQVLLSEAADSNDIADALRLYRAFGLEDTARRAALQLLLLDDWAA